MYVSVCVCTMCMFLCASVLCVCFCVHLCHVYVSVYISFFLQILVGEDGGVGSNLEHSAADGVAAITVDLFALDLQ